MNFEIIVGIILVVSFLTTAWLILKKIPEVKKIPHKDNFIPVGKLTEDIKSKTIGYWNGKVPDFYHFLQNFILKIRELFVKADNRMLDLLLKLKNRTDKGRVELDDYWNDIRTNLQKNANKKKISKPKETQTQAQTIELKKEVLVEDQDNRLQVIEIKK